MIIRMKNNKQISLKFILKNKIVYSKTKNMKCNCSIEEKNN